MRPYPLSSVWTIVPRQDTIASLEVYDEQQNTTTNITSQVTSITYDSGTATINLATNLGSFEPKEGFFYVLYCRDLTGNSVYRTRIYCTNQTNFYDYSLNQGQYIEQPSADTEYIVL